MTLPFLLSALIFLPLLAGAFVLLLGEDDNPGFARGTALAMRLSSFWATCAPAGWPVASEIAAPPTRSAVVRP